MYDWIDIRHKQPPLEEPVWLLQGQQMWIGGRIDTPDGWLWGNCNMTVWFNGEKWDGDMDIDDDYQPTHWMPLPEPLTPNEE